MALPEAEALNNIGGMVRYMPWDGCPRSEYEYGLLVSVVPEDERAFVRFHLGDTAAACALAQLDIIVHPVLASHIGRSCVVASLPGKIIAQSGHGTDGGAAMYQVQFGDGTFGWLPAMDVSFDAPVPE